MKDGNHQIWSPSDPVRLMGPSLTHRLTDASFPTLTARACHPPLPTIIADDPAAFDRFDSPQSANSAMKLDFPINPLVVLVRVLNLLLPARSRRPLCIWPRHKHL